MPNIVPDAHRRCVVFKGDVEDPAALKTYHGLFNTGLFGIGRLRRRVLAVGSCMAPAFRRAGKG